MKPFNVIHYDINRQQFESYDIMPQLMAECKNFKSRTEMEEYIRQMSIYYFWAKCEHEVILKDCLNNDISKKIDVYWQIMNNFDLVVEIFEQNLLEMKSKKRSRKKVNKEI